MVFVIDPLVAARAALPARASRASTRRVRFDSSKATQVILAPRDGGKPRIAECEPFFHYHINNAFEDGDDVVLDLVRYPDYDNIHRGFRDARHSGFDGIDDHAGRHAREPRRRGHDRGPLVSGDASSPSTTGACTSRPHRYTYMAGQASDRRHRMQPFDGDRQDRPRARRHDVHELGRARSRASRSSCRARADSAEDDGWLLSLVYSARRAPLAAGGARRARRRVRPGRGRASAPPRAARLPRDVHQPGRASRPQRRHSAIAGPIFAGLPLAASRD